MKNAFGYGFKRQKACQIDFIQLIYKCNLISFSYTHSIVPQMSLVVFSGALLAVGGSDGLTTLKTIEVYCHETNSWR